MRTPESYYPEIHREIYRKRGENYILIDTSFKTKEGNWDGKVLREAPFSTEEQMLEVVVEFYEELRLFLIKNPNKLKK